jgi:hypothetical protein
LDFLFFYSVLHFPFLLQPFNRKFKLIRILSFNCLINLAILDPKLTLNLLLHHQSILSCQLQHPIYLLHQLLLLQQAILRTAYRGRQYKPLREQWRLLYPNSTSFTCSDHLGDMVGWHAHPFAELLLHQRLKHLHLELVSMHKHYLIRVDVAD